MEKRYVLANFGNAHKNIPSALRSFMASRARARRTVVVEGVSHLVKGSQPDAVVALIDEAAGRVAE